MTTTALTITKADLDADNTYTGTADVNDWQGDIAISADLGWVKFTTSLRASGSIRAEAGAGIEAGWGIKAGAGIEAGFQIVGKWVAAKLRIFAGTCLWRNPSLKERQICAELREGVIAFGEHSTPDARVSTHD